MKTIDTLEHLEEMLSRPTESVIETMRRLTGDLVFLGVGGKMGASLAVMAKRASDAAGTPRRVIGVSRFSNPEIKPALESQGIETVECDLLDEDAVARLPDAALAVFMTGMKFGGSENAARMWAMNTIVPGSVCRRYAGARWLVFSTGNIYPLTSAASGGSVESDAPDPVGEYGMSALGRERVFEYFCRNRGNPMAIVRLNYACDLRYGVLVDLATQIWNGRPIDLTMGHFNTIWQGDANARSLLSLGHAASPPFVINVTGAETLEVHTVAKQLGVLMNKEVQFTGEEAHTALLSNATRSMELFGPPSVATGRLLEWVAHWVASGKPSLNKPTHFQSRDGRF